MATKKEEIEELLERRLMRHFGEDFNTATFNQVYASVLMTVRDILSEKRGIFNEKTREKGGKKVYYLCMEFLIGKSLENNLYNLGLTDVFLEVLKSHHYNLEDLFEHEADAALGNGGLGRLAACYMDSLATLSYPATGFSICYEYGLFKQKIVDGWQTELPDVWLPSGEAGLIPRTDDTFQIRFDGRVIERWENDRMRIEYDGCDVVEAVPYDMPISGYDSNGVSLLRLWRARDIMNFNMHLFSQGDYFKAVEENTSAEVISKVLYPADDHYAGKTLRLKQQYLLVSASLQNILKIHLSENPSLHNLSQKVAIHINDTHPALAVPELMRLLMDENGFSWEEAWEIVTNTIAYTNHTVLSEALETWPEDFIQRKLPRIYSIIKEINERFCKMMWERYPGDWNKCDRVSIISHGTIRMANLSIVGSHKVNGVSQLHSDILKNNVFRDFYDVMPEKFLNVTNGIAHRRWLCESNPRLCELLDKCIGPSYRTKPEKLEDFLKFRDDKQVLAELEKIKRENKVRFAEDIKKRTGEVLNPDSIFDVQVKRLHEYKRQLLNALKIIDLYKELSENPNLDIVPQTFIFGAKAAPGYYLAKEIIRLIVSLGEEIKKNPVMREKIRVLFIEDYNVTKAQILMPAAEISEQISLAGKEASGTGNMKLMINGAVTFGTLDGANVEISQAVGRDNIFLFGLTADQVKEEFNKQYNSLTFYQQNPRIKRAVDAINTGFNGMNSSDIYKYLILNHGMSDPYMSLIDFQDYVNKSREIFTVYKDRERFNKMSLVNIAKAGVFAADRAVKEYADKIWGIESIK